MYDQTSCKSSSKPILQAGIEYYFGATFVDLRRVNDGFHAGIYVSVAVALVILLAVDHSRRVVASTSVQILQVVSWVCVRYRLPLCGQDRQDVLVAEIRDANGWMDHRLIISKMRLRLQPQRRPQGVLGAHGLSGCNDNSLLRLPSDPEKATMVHPRTQRWQLLDYALVRRQDRQDLLVAKIRDANGWTDHRLIISKMRLRIQPQRRPQVNETTTPRDAGKDKSILTFAALAVEINAESEPVEMTVGGNACEQRQRNCCVKRPPMVTHCGVTIATGVNNFRHGGLGLCDVLSNVSTDVLPLQILVLRACWL
ncbi:unnamed protein product [Schistocephalus solidus]|uniref:Uncharacterized protein n=1 Tax=Schistocephalus solidus TaxID=70667 RepID=A0A183T9K1_SCHSO|nr:unnamed protein product [Schistocephalus solidus]